MDNKYQFLILIFFLFVTLNTNSLSQNLSPEIDVLTKGADVIVTGKVTKQDYQWNKTKTRIYTNVTIDVEEYLKGNKTNKEITVTHLGGEVGSNGEWYSHVPSFSIDEEVLLFLKNDRQNSKYEVMNGEDGKLNLYKDQKTGERMTSFNAKVSSLKNEIKNYVRQY